MNVVNSLKNHSVEAIKDYCKKNCNKASFAMFNTNYDFNISSIIRTANIMGFSEVHHIQKEGKRIDRRATVGAHHYTDVIHSYNADEFFEKIRNKYVPIAVENNVDYQSFDAYKFVFPSNACFIFGSENEGLTKDVLDRCESMITIPNFGAIRSFNVGVTAAIIGGLFIKQTYENS
jgi:tRNA (guanosine-2'-O-)-methyltransferase